MAIIGRFYKAGNVARPSGGADWIPAMAGSLHPPCRRKKLRPLRPRLGRGLRSAPFLPPLPTRQAARGPSFPSRRKRDCARRRVPEANRREAAALRPEANGPCTVQKSKRSIAPAGDGRRGDAQEVLPPGTQVSSLRHSLCGGFGGYRMDKLLFPLPLTWLQRVDVRLFPGLPFYRQATL